MSRRCLLNIYLLAQKGALLKIKLINSTELEKYAKDYLEKLFGNATPILGISAYHFLEPTNNGYVMKRYSSFIINESAATEVQENKKEVKI